jgi:hypothetical protein
MRSISASIVINASRETVWNVLTNFAHYPAWNPFIISVEGRAETGTYLKNSMLLNGKTQVFTPKVLEAMPNQTLVWLGSLWVKGLFDGRHEFVLEEISPEQTRLVQQEFFSGVLSGFILKMIGEATLENFRKMNEALKTEAEKVAIVA